MSRSNVFEIVVAGFAPESELLRETLEQALYPLGVKANHEAIYRTGALHRTKQEVHPGLTPQKRRITIKVEILP